MSNKVNIYGELFPNYMSEDGSVGKALDTKYVFNSAGENLDARIARLESPELHEYIITFASRVSEINRLRIRILSDYYQVSWHLGNAPTKVYAGDDESTANQISSLNWVFNLFAKYISRAPEYSHETNTGWTEGWSKVFSRVDGLSMEDKLFQDLFRYPVQAELSYNETENWETDETVRTFKLVTTEVVSNKSAPQTTTVEFTVDASGKLSDNSIIYDIYVQHVNILG